MKASECFVSVIAPFSNESEILEAFVSEVVELLQKHYAYYELILINDGSEDATSAKLSLLLKEYEGIRAIDLSRHFGSEVAISCGLDTAIGDIVVVMLPASDPPELIPELVERCRHGENILIGVRQKRSGEPLWMKVGSNLFYWFCLRILKIPLTKNATQFRVMSRQVVNALTQIDDKYRYLRLLGNYIGYKNQTFIYQPIRRSKNIQNRSIFASINLAFQIIFINSVHPLRFASYLSILASLFNIAYIGYVVLVFFIKEKVAEGWITLSIQNAVMFLLISIILAILCEYVGLMVAKSRGWAAYYIAEEKSSSVLIMEPERPNIIRDSEDTKI
jgi:glycosyltransferase involved in cell wall biosynthesis